jgi:hypothetical protein
MTEALRFINAHPEQLATLATTMRQLDISYIAWIGYTRPESERYIQMLFDSHVPVGVLYVPDSGGVALQNFLEEAKGTANYPYNQVEHLRGGWFYFQGRT